LQDAVSDVIGCNLYGNSADGFKTYCIGYDGCVNDCNIYNNSGTGINYYDARHFSIENCTVYNNNIGVYLYWADGTKMRNTVMYNNNYNFCSYLNGGKLSDPYDIDDSVTINGRPFVWLVNQNDMVIDETTYGGDVGYIGLVSCNNITVKNIDTYGALIGLTSHSTFSNVVSHNGAVGFHTTAYYNYPPSSYNTFVDCTVYNCLIYGFYANEYAKDNTFINCVSYDCAGGGTWTGWGFGTRSFSSGNDFVNCVSYGNGYGFFPSSNDNGNFINCAAYNNRKGGLMLWGNDDCNIINSTFCNNGEHGIELLYSANGHNIIGCNIHNNGGHGIYIHGAPIGEMIYHNNLINNAMENAYDDCNNIWDDGYPSGGNYWGDYTGIDNDGDGIGDTPYNISGGGNQDLYPFMEPLRAIPALLSPIDNVGIEDQTPTFDWTDVWHSCCMTYTLQVATDPGFTSIVINEVGLVESEYTPLGDLPFDTYYWQVQVTLSGGLIMDWSETWSFSIALDVIPPTTPYLIEPTDGSTLIITPAIFFDWTDAYDLHGIDYYTMQIATDVNFVNIVFDIMPGDSDYTLTLTTTDDYYWRIQAVDNNGLLSSWSNVWMFTRLADTNPPVVELIYPVGGEYLVGDVTILWDATDDITPNLDLPITIEYRCGGPWQILASGEVNDGEYLWDTTGYPDGTLYKIRISTEDFWGNIGSDESYATFTVDNTDPLTTVYLNPASPDGDNDWYVSDVCITLVATDETSGIDYTMYMIDSGSWEEYVVPVTVSEDGEHTVEFYSVDNAGNEEAIGEVTFKIDKTVPTIDFTWDDENSLLIADVDDETSGVAMVEFYVNGVLIGEVTSAPYEMEYEASSGDTAYGIVYDNAGNSAESEIIESSQGNLQSQTNPVLTRILQRYTMLKI
jgi:parallel beta-helix repeat protein